LRITGKCEECGDFTHPNLDDNECIADVCTDRDILIEDGTC
jgi:hypothetical protein